MSCRDLKHFDAHKRKLKRYAKAIGIKLKYRKLDTEGVYGWKSRSIWIDVDLENSEEISALLHELGHAMDDDLTNFKSMFKLNRAYDAIYSPGYTQHQLELVLACEKRAWKYGKIIAKMLKIPLGKWYTSFARESLQSYRSIS